MTHLFIGGLHRSGTSALNRLLQAHPLVTGFSGTGASEDEGQHLQSVIPHDGEFGGPGEFCFHAGARLTEVDMGRFGSRVPEIVARWAHHWDQDAPIKLEKSPPNLIRARFLQAAFPDAKFVFIVRHPIAVALATAKWSKSSTRDLIHHWIAGHRTLLTDLPHILRWRLLRYEDLAASPDHALEPVWRMLNIARQTVGSSQFTDHNGRYFEMFERSTNAEVVSMSSDELDAIARFGYSLAPPFTSPGFRAGSLAE